MLWIDILCAVERHPKPKFVYVLVYLALSFLLSAMKGVIDHMLFVAVEYLGLPPLLLLQVLHLTDLQGIVVVLIPSEGFVSGESLFEARSQIVPAHYKFILLISCNRR